VGNKKTTTTVFTLEHPGNHATLVGLFKGGSSQISEHEATSVGSHSQKKWILPNWQAQATFKGQVVNKKYCISYIIRGHQIVLLVRMILSGSESDF
jgi:hypothetical protein